jgi:hypothetical protein
VSTAPSATASAPWLLLAYQLPSRPSNARVSTWRRLQRVGAVQVHGSVYALPATLEAREDLEWIAEEVVGHGGQATLFVADTTEAAARDRMVEAFRRARSEEYAAIRAEAEKASGESPRTLDALAARLRERLTAAAAVDFFAAPGRDDAEAAIDRLRLRPEDLMSNTTSETGGEKRLAARDFRDRVWVTRPRPGIDRMSTAWLVRRFIDPQATFRFADPERRAELGPAAVPFDMYGVELGHQRGGCTFETVARRFAIGDPTVAWLARIVHQLDLKTAEPPIAEAAVIGRMVEGLRRMYADDAELLERGMTMFEALYQSESERRSAGAKPSPRSEPAAAKAKPKAKRAGSTKPARRR